MPSPIVKKSPPLSRWGGFRMFRIIVAAAVLVTFLLSFIDFRQAFPKTWGHYLAQIQFTPALESTLAGVVWPSLVILALLLVGTLIFGRVYCSFLCPLGIFQDIVSRLSRLIRGKKYKALRYSKPVKGIRAAFLILFFGSFLAGLQAWIVGWLDPYSQFGRLCNMFLRPAATEINNLLTGVSDSIYRVAPQWPQVGWLVIPVAAMLLLVTVMAALRGRLYCNTVCPVGALLGLISRYSAFRMTFDKSACVKCARCMKACKSQCIDLKNNEIDYSRCISCFDCEASCNEHGLRYRFVWGHKKQSHQKESASCSCARNTRDSQKKDIQNKTLPGATTADASQIIGALPPTSRRAFLGASVLGALATATAYAADKKLTSPSVSKRAISPPGSQSVAHFLDHCTACHLCLEACPTKCLRPAYLEYGAKGFLKPHLTFEQGFCNFDCTACADVCPAGAILPLPLKQKQKTRIAKAHFDDQMCIVTKDKRDCGACSEHCPTKALDMVLIGKVITQPECNLDYCARCDDCVKACPHGAITQVPDPDMPGHKKPVFDHEKCTGCHKCLKACEAQAITMKPAAMNLRIPRLDAEVCIGCGACECACPEKAVTVAAIAIHEEARQIVEEQVVNPNAGEDFPF